MVSSVESVCAGGFPPFRFDVRLTHNHVTISGSILRPIILLLLNYIARYSTEREKKTFCIARKKTFQTFFHIRAIIYICRRALFNFFFFSFSTLFDNVSHVCWLRQIFARCVNEKSVECCVFFEEVFFFANSQNVANFQFDEINFFREDLSHQFSLCLRNALCVRNRSHSSHI